jgi:hypothetical protein
MPEIPSKLVFVRRLGLTWKELADLFDVKSYERAGWPKGDEPRALWEYLEDRGRLTELPAALLSVDRPDLAETLSAEALTTEALTAERTPARSARRGVLLAGAAAAVLGAGAWAGIVALRTDPPADYLTLTVAPAPTVTSWVPAPTCEARTQWSNRFPSTYVGDVYVQFTADPGKRVDVHAALFWGGRTWAQIVPAAPGDIARRSGGTMLVFEKRSVDTGRASGVVFETDIPVCATFGTADDPVLAAPAIRLPTPRWR